LTALRKALKDPEHGESAGKTETASAAGRGLSRVVVPERVGTGRLSDDVRLARKGLRLRSGMTFDAWMGVGRRLAEISNASAWWLGDWLVYGHRTYGQRYKIALEATSLDYQTLRNYAWVARRFEVCRRREGLSFQHHAEVAALPEAEQELWLNRAESRGWSRNELRRRTFGVQRSRKNAGPAARVTCRFTVAADREERWRRAAAMTEQSLAQWMIRAADAAADAVLPRSASRTSEE
jgi:hypothetical protein